MMTMITTIIADDADNDDRTEYEDGDNENDTDDEAKTNSTIIP